MTKFSLSVCQLLLSQDPLHVVFSRLRLVDRAALNKKRKKTRYRKFELDSVYTYRRSISKLMCFISLIGGQSFRVVWPRTSLSLPRRTDPIRLCHSRRRLSQDIRGQILDKRPANGTFLFKHNLNDF